MRPLLLALVLLLLVPVPPGAAQESIGVVTDGEGDVRLETQGTPAPGPPEVYSGIDLVGLGITEDKSDLTFSLQVADLKPGDQETSDGLHYQVTFQHNGRQFRLDLQTALRQLGEIGWFTTLEMRDDPQAEWTQTWVSLEDGRSDPVADLVSLTLPRDLLADKDGTPPFPGRAIEDIQVRASGYFSDIQVFGGILPDVRSPVKVLDDMPDAGQAAGRYDIVVGLAQTGHARLTSQVPYRASNGEATTFLFNATAHNLADREDTFEFRAVGAPARLAVTVPVTAAAIPAGGAVSVPVLVTIPFAHIHGGVDDFALEMRSTSDPGSVGRLAMGVRYLSVPQPAGHHDSLYLHSGGAPGLLGGFSNGAYMNTLEQDEGDTKQPIPSAGLSVNGPNLTYRWYIALEPGLQMGLDLDLARQGMATIPIGSPVVPLLGTTVEVTLYTGDLFQPAVPVAHMAPVGPVDILPQSTHLFEGPLVPDPGADRIPFDPAANLYMEVYATTVSPSPIFTQQPFLGAGGHLSLPLLEYHDPVDTALNLLGGPGLAPLGEQERLVNPGKAVVFPFSLANPAGEQRAYHIEVSGANMDWGMLPSNHITVPAHGTASGSLIVRAPAGAVDGDRADLILQAHDVSDPTARGLLRLVAEVDTSLDHPDDTAVADDLSAKKESPGVPSLLAVGLLALLAVRRRR